MFYNYIKYIKQIGVKYGASEEEIREAYKKMAKIYHPDKGGSEEKFKELNEAYDFLKSYGFLYSMTLTKKIGFFVGCLILGIILLILLGSLLILSSALSLFLLFVLFIVILCIIFYYLFVFGTVEEIYKLKQIKTN